MQSNIKLKEIEQYSIWYNSLITIRYFIESGSFHLLSGVHRGIINNYERK